MVAFWMCNVAPTEIAGSDALNRNQLSYRRALHEDRPARVGRVFTKRRKLRVLVVDDDHDKTDALARLVNHWEHFARSAYSGGGALRVAAVQHPDVMLLDLTLPDMDGCQVGRQLRLDFSEHDCFIIAFTGYCDEQIHQQCESAGIDVVLIKPVESFVVEALLMLECERINRRPGGTPSESRDGSGRIARQITSTRTPRRL